MSNLSDLLPAGAGAKSATFTADGTLATGTTVALQSDGTVTEVAETTVATTTGSSTEFFTYSGTGVDSMNYAYDTANDRLLLTYRSGGTAYYRVGTVSGTSISFGSEDTYISANAYDIRTVYDSTNARFVSCYTDFSNSAYGTAVVSYISNVGSGTVSGGTPVVFNSASTAWAKPVYDSANSKVVISYRDSGNTYGESVVGTVSGTSISFGSTATFESSSVLSVSSAYDANAGKVVVSYRNNGPGKSIVGTVSGTSISFGSSTQFFAAVDNVGTFTVYDPSTNKVAVGFCDSNASNQLKAIVGTVSGTSISFGSVTTVNTNDILPGDAVFDSNRNKVVFTYRDKGNSFYGTLNAGTISGTSITFDSNHVFASLNAANQGAAFDPDTNQVAIAYENGPGNTNLTSIGAVTTNSADFIGITDEAIADTATGSVVVEGGVTEKLSGLTVGADYYVQDDGSLAATSIPYDISSASYDSVSFSVTSQDTEPVGLTFNTDGTKMFIVGTTNDNVYEYALSTAYDISSASYTQSFSVSSQDTFPTGVRFNNDGTKMFVVGGAGQDINEYGLSSAFDISSASYTRNFSTSAQETAPNGLAFNTDGTKMFVSGGSGQDVNEYSLSTGFDLSSVTFTQNFSVSSQDTLPREVTFNSDGTKMYIVGSTNDSVFQYNLTTGFDLSTASYANISFSLSSQDTSPEGIAFNSSGTKMYIVGDANDSVYQYSTTAASTTVVAGKALSTTKLLLKG